MSRHVPTQQIVDHIISAAAVSVDGTIFKKIENDGKNLVIGTFKFPLDYFDIGGISPHTIILMDNEQKFHDLMMLGVNGYKINHPEWKHEEYDAARLRNQHLAEKFYYEQHKNHS